jgi:kynureninase
MSTPTRDDAAALDAADPLAAFRERFVIHDDPVAYLDGNSLGRPPRATVERIHHLLDVEWATQLIRSWEAGWMDLPEQVGDRLGAAVLGAAPGQTVIADSTTVNLFKVLHAAAGLSPGRRELVIDEANFPTDRYIVEAVASSLGLVVRWIPATETAEAGVTAEILAPRLGPGTAAVVLSQVDYRTGYLADLPGLTALIHAAGAVSVWDLCHSAGAVPIDLDRAGVDFAVGCSYKYLNAGPGAPAFIYVAERHLGALAQPIPGWCSAADIFAMAPVYERAAGIRAMLSGTPNVIGIVAVDEGVNLVAEAGIDAIRAKSVALTTMADRLARDVLGLSGWTVASPGEPTVRGGHVTVRGPGAASVTARLAERGVIVDFRHPDMIRLGLSPLTTTYGEVWTAVHALADVVVGP